MAETGTVASIAQRIFHVLQKNHSSEGLTVEEIKRLARLEGIYAGKIYQALGKLMRQHEVKYKRSATDRRKGTYLLVIQQEDELDTLIEQQSARIKQATPTSKQAREKVLTHTNHSLIQQPEFSRILEEVLREYVFISSPKYFPPLLGLYAIFNGTDGTCLYIGQARDLFKRGRYHWTWNEAVSNYDAPCAAYKLIEGEDPGEVHRELIYEESLLIGLLRPLWNNVTPSLKNGFIPDTVEKFKQIRWNQLASIYHEPFHPAMLTDEGYSVLKEVEITTESGRIKTRWRRIIYDKQYVKQWLKSFADKIDDFFSTQQIEDSQE